MITYNTFIGTCEKGKQLEQALGMFKELLQQDVVPGTVAYSALISACTRNEWPRQALELFQAMRQ